MHISVSGKGVDVGERLREHMEQRLSQGISKYLDRVTSVQSVLSKDAHRFRVDLHGNIGTHAGMVVRASAMGDDAYTAFDAALEKIEKQLRRYKRKITNHHKNVSSSAGDVPMRGRKYVLSPDIGEQETEEGGSGPMQAAAVIAEKSTDIDKLSVSEAVMRMDLQDLPALMFYNAAHGRLNIVYRRADGNIAWVDPDTASSS
ncbi:MAG: ribosome-associated translation inhibitor RaiA [Alphaproteobacteria bacterium]|nr:ribosome-associated translation inhibitor RaiA [Alphaproteobacteria bacterium]